MSHSRPVALISGGGSGIGLALASRLAATHDLALLGRSSERLEQASKRLHAHSLARVITLPVDVTDRVAVGKAVSRVADMLGRIDWVVAAAGISQPGFFAESRYETHVEAMATNYFGSLALVTAALPVLKRQTHGRLILFASACVFSPIAGYSTYAPSKSALTSLGKILSVELANDAIGVHIVFPPDTDTDQYREELPNRPSVTSTLARQTGLWSADAVAQHVLRAVARNQLIIIPARLSRFDVLLAPIIWPWFAWRQRRLMAKYDQPN